MNHDYRVVQSGQFPSTCHKPHILLSEYFHTCHADQLSIFKRSDCRNFLNLETNPSISTEQVEANFTIIFFLQTIQVTECEMCAQAPTHTCLALSFHHGGTDTHGNEIISTLHGKEHLAFHAALRVTFTI